MNIMTSQVAKEIFHVKKVITRIFNPRSKVLFEEFGLDTVCSTTLTVNAFIRSLEEEKVEEVHRVFGTDITYSDIGIENKFIGMPVSVLSAETGEHVAGLIRKGKMILAMPDLAIEEGDHAVLLLTQ